MRTSNDRIGLKRLNAIFFEKMGEIYAKRGEFDRSGGERGRSGSIGGKGINREEVREIGMGEKGKGRRSGVLGGRG